MQRSLLVRVGLMIGEEQLEAVGIRNCKLSEFTDGSLVPVDERRG